MELYYNIFLTNITTTIVIIKTIVNYEHLLKFKEIIIKIIKNLLYDK